MSNFTITKNEKAENGEVVIEGKLALVALEKQKANALAKFNNSLNLDGFRKGHIPEKKLIEMIGELALLEEQASLALEKNYLDIVKEVKINPIGSPKVSIVKIAPKLPVEFKIETTVLPDIKLPDYKKIAVEENKKEQVISVEEKEIEQALQEMRRSLAHYEAHHKDSEGEDHHDHTGKDIPDEELPALDDEFAKKVGKFENLSELKIKLKESIEQEKKNKNKEKNRLLIIDGIIEKTEVLIPEILVKSEQQKMLAEMKANIERMGIVYDEYLVHIKKTEEELITEWKDQAVKRVKMELILNDISIKENIKVEQDEIKREAEMILKTYRDADPIRVESYVESMLINEKVWLFLENQK